MEDANTILPDHTAPSLSPEQKTIYKQYPLLAGTRQVRFLRIQHVTVPGPQDGMRSLLHCSFEIQELLPESRYLALSYTWGPEEVVAEDWLMIDGVLWPMRRNLADALHNIFLSRREEGLQNWWTRSARHEQSGFAGSLSSSQDSRILLWIDYLCIDQSNALERNHQVAQMSQIYRLATIVIVWLGHDDEYSISAMPILDQIFRLDLVDGRPMATSSGVLYDATSPTDAQLISLNKLLWREYWRRMWTVQEWLLAHQLLVLTTSSSFSIPASVRFERSRWQHLLRALLRRATSMCSVAGPGWTLLLGEPSGHSHVLRSSWKTLFLDLPRDRLCLDARDRVFGVLGLTHADPAWPTVDYTLSLLELFAEVVRKFACISEAPDEVPQFARSLARNLGFDAGDEAVTGVVNKATAIAAKACEDRELESRKQQERMEAAFSTMK